MGVSAKPGSPKRDRVERKRKSVCCLTCTSEGARELAGECDDFRLPAWPSRAQTAITTQVIVCVTGQPVLCDMKPRENAMGKFQQLNLEGSPAEKRGERRSEDEGHPTALFSDDFTSMGDEIDLQRYTGEWPKPPQGGAQPKVSLRILALRLFPMPDSREVSIYVNPGIRRKLPYQPCFVFFTMISPLSPAKFDTLRDVCCKLHELGKQ